MSGLLFVVTAASGTGKTSLVKALLEETEGLCVSVSHTTRARRPGEIDGIDYHFSSRDAFQAQINAGEFIEFAEVFGNLYGTHQKSVSDQLAEGKDVLLEIDWQGAAQVRRIFPDCHQIFIIPPTQAALRERLQGRGQDSAEVIEQRLRGSLQEMQQYVQADYLIINDDFAVALKHLSAVIEAARLTLAQQSKRHAGLLSALMNGEKHP